MGVTQTAGGIHSPWSRHPLDKAKDHSKPKMATRTSRCTLLASLLHSGTVVAEIALRLGDKAVLELLSSPYQLATKGTSGCDMLSTMVQTFREKYIAAVVIIHDAANAYNSICIMDIQQADMTIAAQDMLKRIFLEPQDRISLQGDARHRLQPHDLLPQSSG